MNTAIKKTGFGILLGILLIVGTQFASAQWFPPTTAPTGGNAAAPVNTSTFPQIKPGFLGLQELVVQLNAHLSYLANPNSEHICATTSGFLILCPATPGNNPSPVIPPVSGYCGSADGMAFQSVPTTNLCDSGTATAVTGSGPWTWSCNGSNGGTSSSCQALTGYELTVTKNAIACSLGPITTSSAPLVWNGNIGKATYPASTIVTLGPTSGTCISGVSWTGASAGTVGCPYSVNTVPNDYCTVVMSSPRSVTAGGSNAPSYLLTIHKPNGDTSHGNITASNGSLSWNNITHTYTGTYVEDTTVVLQATNSGGATFVAWSGDINGTSSAGCTEGSNNADQPVCTLSMYGARTVYALFDN